MDCLSAASNLRSLLQSHDRFVHNLDKIGKLFNSLILINSFHCIYVLFFVLLFAEKYLNKLTKKLSKGKEEGYITAGSLVLLRKSMVEGLCGVIEEYKQSQWQEIQNCVNGIISQLSNQEQNGTHTHDGPLSEAWYVNYERFVDTVHSFDQEHSQFNRSS